MGREYSFADSRLMIVRREPWALKCLKAVPLEIKSTLRNEFVLRI
jgi:hypothetical protein